MSKIDPKDRAASSVVAELHEINNLLIARCANHARARSDLEASRDDALAAAKAALGEIETLKAEKADLAAQASSVNTPAA